MNSISAVKDAIGGGSFSGSRDVYVYTNGQTYIYKNVGVYISYNIGYMQMDVSVMWDEDSTQVSYTTLGLHKGYNTNFQTFTNNGSTLQWSDGTSQISVRF